MRLFKDLPSTDTPINAENLNQIADKLIVVSPTFPEGDNKEKLWIRIGKNHLDIANGATNTITKNGVTITKNADNTLTLNGTCEYDFPIVILNEISRDLYNKYTLSYKVKSGSMTGGSVRISITNKTNSDPIATDSRLLSVVWTSGATSGSDTQTVADLAQHLSFWVNAGCTFNNCNISLQLEQGTETEHEAYIEPRIYVKNDNDEYEKFFNKENLDTYSTEETKIGTWIDGKPIYRKVIKTISVSNSYADLNIAGLVDVKVLATVNNRNLFNTGRYNNSEDMFTWYVDTANKLISIDVGTTWTFNEAIITLEYTKTTDS